MKVKISETDLWSLYIVTPAGPSDPDDRLIDLPDALVDRFRAAKLELIEAQNEIQRLLNVAGYRI